jgi:hypothetical protein
MLSVGWIVRGICIGADRLMKRMFVIRFITQVDVAGCASAPVKRCGSAGAWSHNPDLGSERSTAHPICVQIGRGNFPVKRLTSKVKAWFLLKSAVERLTHKLRVQGSEKNMRKASVATVAMILAIALYFTLAWGYDALRTLTAPNYGLEDVWRSQYIFAIGRIADLGPLGLIKLAAFFAAMKLSVAGICGLHILDRLRSLAGGTANSEILEGALILVVLTSIVSVGPAVWSSNADLLREHTFQLVLAAVATALCIVERHYWRADAPAETALAQGATWFSPWR